MEVRKKAPALLRAKTARVNAKNPAASLRVPFVFRAITIANCNVAESRKEYLRPWEKKRKKMKLPRRKGHVDNNDSSTRVQSGRARMARRNKPESSSRSYSRAIRKFRGSLDKFNFRLLADRSCAVFAPSPPPPSLSLSHSSALTRSDRRMHEWHSSTLHCSRRLFEYYIRVAVS